MSRAVISADEQKDTPSALQRVLTLSAILLLLTVSILLLSFHAEAENSTSTNSSNSSLNSTTNSTNTTNSTKPCNVTLNLFFKDRNSSSVDGETVKFYNNISSEAYSYKIEYWVEDLQSRIWKDKYNTSNDYLKRYTPKIEEEDRVLIFKNRLAWINCTNSVNVSENRGVRIIYKVLSSNNSSNTTNSSTNRTNSTNSNTTNSTNSTNSSTTPAPESSITIEELSSEKVQFGDTVRAKANVYKGDTSKISVRSYIENGEERVSRITYFNLYDKYKEVEVKVPVLIDNNCEWDFENGDYSFVMEGLNATDKKSFEIEDLIESHCPDRDDSQKDCPPRDCSSTTSSTISYTPEKKEELVLTDFNKTLIKGNSLSATVTVNNIFESRKHYEVYSYIYRGSKSYSGERDSNNRAFKLESSESKEVTLKSSFQGEPGEYKLKVKLFRAGRKTPIELREEVVVEEGEKEESSEENTSVNSSLSERGEKDGERTGYNNSAKNGTGESQDKITGKTVYENKENGFSNVFKVVSLISAGILLLVLGQSVFSKFFNTSDSEDEE